VSVLEVGAGFRLADVLHVGFALDQVDHAGAGAEVKFRLRARVQDLVNPNVTLDYVRIRA
jgi:uncharacterized UPF0146 family protein